MAETTMTDHVIAEAERLYLYDPVFHAQVRRTVDVLADEHRQATGERMGEDLRKEIGRCAAVALTVARMFTDG